MQRRHVPQGRRCFKLKLMGSASATFVCSQPLSMPSKAAVMQLTLVSHYLEKPPEFARLLQELQASLSRMLGDSFRSYELAQVHGTIIGLEGVEIGEGIRNENFLRCRHEEKWMDFDGLLAFLRTEVAGFSIRIGGFKAADDYGFVSQSQHPFLRSFSLQKEIAVAMGWPFQGGMISPALNNLRRRLQLFGVLHKWHRRPDDVDNDFFFVLGQIKGALPAKTRKAAENELRGQFSRREPLLLPFNSDSLSIVAYRDSQLPLGSSCARRLTDPDLTGDCLRETYAEHS
jgi:hypothetical protein